MSVCQIRREKSGFTLMELLATTAIVGILVTLSIANYDEYKKNIYFMISKVAQRDLRVAVETWVGTDWDRQGGTYVTWTHYGDGTNTYGGVGAQLADYYPASKDDGIFWYVTVSINCYAGIACNGSPGFLHQVGTGHCKAPLSSDPTQVRYNIFHLYEASPTYPSGLVNDTEIAYPMATFCS